MATFTRQAVSASEAKVMALGFTRCYDLTDAQKAARDWDMAASLDKKGDEYLAAGNEVMAKVCRERALGAANRAVKYSV